MSEMAYVPLIRPWLGREYRMLAHEFYGRRGGFFFAWGWLFWLWAIYVGIKAAVFWSIVILMVALWCITATIDLCTYRYRLRLAQQIVSGETA